MVYCLLIFYKRPRKPRLAIDWQILQAGNEFWTQQILEKLPSQRFVVSIMAQVYPFQINRVFSNMAEKWKKNWMSLWIWEMRALLLAGGSDLPRLLILSRSVGTLVARLGRREARRMQRETRGPDCAKTRKRTKCAGNSVRWPNTSPMLLHL